MADAAADKAALKAEYIRLVDVEKVPREEAQRRIRAKMGAARPLPSQPQAQRATRPVSPDVSGAESFGRGAVQGATMGYSDEIAGAVAVDPLAMAAGPMASDVYVDPAIIGIKGSASERYTQARDDQRAKNDAARESNPKIYLVGQATGGALTAPVLPAATTVKGTAAVGAGVGAIAGLGESKADLTKGEVGSAAVDTAIGATVGGVIGGAVSGAFKGAGRLYRRMRGEPAAAQKLASKVAGQAEELSQIGHKQTVASFEQRSSQREAAISETIGEQFRFKAGQATGDPSAALADRTAEQMTATMRKAQEESVKQSRQYAKYLDMKVRGLAADPAKLGRADVSEALAGDVQRYAESLAEERSRVASQMFGAVDEIAGNKRIVPVRNTVETIMRLASEKQSPASAGSSRAALKELEALSEQFSKTSESGAPIDARFTAGELQRALADWGKKASSGGADVFDKVEAGEARHMSGAIFAALKRDLDAAASEEAASQIGAAGQALVDARDAYRVMSEEIEEAGTETVKRILKIGASDASDTITSRLVSPGTSPEQIEGVFRVLNKASPDTAQQLRAQLLDDLLVKAGKPSAAAPYSRDLGISQLQPGTALSLLSQAEPKLQAAYAGQPAAKLALREVLEDLQRLSFGPGIKGSDTASKLDQVAGLAAAGMPGGEAVKQVVTAVRKISGNDAAFAKAISTPDGLQAFRRGLRAAVGKETLSDDAARTVAVALTRYAEGERKQIAERVGRTVH